MLEGNMLVMGIMILLAVVTVVAVLYFGTREEEGSSGHASDSVAVNEWSKRAEAREESNRQTD